MKASIKRIQTRIGVTADGVIGPKTCAALEEWLGIAKVNGAVAAALKTWPTQAEVRAGRSVFGKAGNEAVLVSIVPAYPLFYAGQAVRSIRVHQFIAEDVQQALQEVLDYYGPERIRELGLDQYDGSYAYRMTTGASSLSMHAWGIALDFAAATNAMNTHAPQATLSRPECAAWWEIWERHGAVSMGRVYDKDWMHLQFARFDG